MHTKEVGGEKILVHCAWQLTNECEDIDNDLDKVVEEAAKLNIDIISSSICNACMIACFDEDEKFKD
jgi:hypothetical protein